jgi:hypothetical protein
MWPDKSHLLFSGLGDSKKFLFTARKHTLGCAFAFIGSCVKRSLNHSLRIRR